MEVIVARRRTAGRLTSRQEQILNWIESRPTPPSYREIAEEFGFRSLNSVSVHLKAMARKGFLVLTGDGTSRHIRVIPEWWRIQRVVLAFASWMQRSGEINTAQEALAVIEAPHLFTHKFDEFCQLNPKFVEQLQSQQHWRR